MKNKLKGRLMTYRGEILVKSMSNSGVKQINSKINLTEMILSY